MSTPLSNFKDSVISGHGFQVDTEIQFMILESQNKNANIFKMQVVKTGLLVNCRQNL